MRFPFIFLLLVLSGCGYSSDHAIGSHVQNSTTFRNISSVITGTVTTGTLPRPVSVTAGVQVNEVFLDNEFYFASISAVQAATSGVELTATLGDGKTLYSFYRGTPIRNSDITLEENIDWHGETGTRLEVGGKKPGSNVSINPFSNVARWLQKANFSSYSAARTMVNEKLQLELCRFEEQLCPDHLAYLQSGKNIYATKNGFVITTPGQPDCVGTITAFPTCQ